MAVKIRCTECREKFPYDPQARMMRCPNCGVRWDEDFDDKVIAMPSLKSAGTKSVDHVYREMERTSEIRAEKAAEMAGVPVSEMSGLKITNMSDRREAGVMSAIPVRNSVTDFMQANPQAGGFQGANGVHFSGAVQTGPMPNVGAHMRTAIQNSHSDMVARHAVGQDHHGRRVIPSTDVTSDRPGLETLQPGYRRRG